MHDQGPGPAPAPADYARLGRATRELRAMRGISQERLGLDAGLHRNYVGAIERGEINPTFRTLLALSAGLRLPPSALLLRYEQPPAADRM